MRKGLTLLVFLATLLGALFGLACHALIHDPAGLASLLQALGLITTLLLRAVKMLIAPLVLATLAPRFRFTIQPEIDVMPVPAFTLHPVPGIPAIITPRE